MNFPHTYQVHISWQHDRVGLLSGADIPTTLEVATPPPFPGGVEKAWSPEHLFTAAVNSCYMTTFLAIAENSRLAFEAFECGAVGELDLVEGQYKMTRVTLHPKLIITHETDETKALRMLEKAEKACLMTNSVKATVSLQPTVWIARPA
jgi:peroxiredoxin-like protein